MFLPPKHTLQASERIKSRKLIQELFTSGHSFGMYPLRILFTETGSDKPSLQAGFTVGTKHFKRAVQRNRIKRLLRETYRVHKHTLRDALEEEGKQLAVFILYTGKEMPTYQEVESRMKAALLKLQQTIVPEYGL